MAIRWRPIHVSFLLFAMSAICRADITFEFTLPKAATTSAGVFTPDGKLVRVLWTMQKFDAGHFTRSWDGRDEFGAEAPAGDYQFKAAANRATYRNVGAIGNSGLPPDPAHHTPTAMLSVVVDSEGSIYTAHGWDEAGADFKKWDKDGNSVYDAQYQIRNGQPNGAPYSVAVDDDYLYCGMGGWADPTWKEAQQIQRFHRKDGKAEKFTKVNRPDGHIQIYEWPSKRMPAGASEADQDRYKLPLRALAIRGDTIFCADWIGNRILKFNKVTGESLGEFPVEMPQALAIDNEGRLWVGHSHHLVTIFEADGRKIAEPINDLGEIEAISFAPRHELAIADSVAAQVKTYSIDRDSATSNGLLGEKARPGDRSPSSFFHLRGVAFCPDGDLVTIQNEPVGGARLAKWHWGLASAVADEKLRTPSKRVEETKLAWEQFGCEFVSLGNYGPDDPDTFCSMTFHNYRLLDHDAGKWEYTGEGLAEAARYRSDPHGVPRLLKLGENHFFFLPTGDGVQIYRVEKNVFHLAALVGGRSPSPDGKKEGDKLGQWTWHDAVGDGSPQPTQIEWFKQPGEGHYSVFGIDVDSQGNIWFANTETQSIVMIPIGPLDPRGNPTYDWKNARDAVAKDASPLKFRPNMAQHADDGSIYAFGWSDKWPEPKNNPFWMGGTTLARFDAKGNRLWAVQLPALCVGLDSIPGGGGCMAGQGDGAKIHHFTSDGLYVGMLSPGDAMAKQSGWLDNHASVAINRDPHDQVLDIFAEDDLVLRIGWYRVDDRKIEVISGIIRKS